MRFAASLTAVVVIWLSGVAAGFCFGMLAVAEKWITP